MASLHRYPVKSLLGEQVTHLDVDERGCLGDRLWSVRTAEDKMGSGKNSRRFAAIIGLLELRASERDGAVVVTFPDGGTHRVDSADAAERLSRHFGQPLTFARETQVSHFDDGPVSLMGCASVEAVSADLGAHVDPARFRPNVVLDTGEAFVEDSWVGRQVRIGTAVLDVSLKSTRCVMVDMKTADLPALAGNLRATARVNHTCLGVVASVASGGRITVGDSVTLF